VQYPAASLLSGSSPPPPRSERRSTRSGSSSCPRDHAPELSGYLLNPAERLPAPGLGIGLWQFVTVAGMVAVITSVLAGAAGGLLAAVASGRSLVAALVAGVAVAAAVLTRLMLYQKWAARSRCSPVQRTQTEPAWTAHDLPRVHQVRTFYRSRCGERRSTRFKACSRELAQAMKCRPPVADLTVP